MKNSAQNIAKQVAKQLAAEPLEILKTTSEQITENKQTENVPQEKSPEVDNSQQEINDKLRSQRRIEAYQRELEDIHKQDLFRDLQEKISQGIEVPLENYSELSIEQKQVLMAQMEAVKLQMANKQMTNDKLIIPGSKRGRRLGSSQKQEAEKQQTRVEKPVPPSG